MAKLSAHQSPVKKHLTPSSTSRASATSSLSTLKTGSLDIHRSNESNSSEETSSGKDGEPLNIYKGLAELNISTANDGAPRESRVGSDDTRPKLFNDPCESLGQERLARRDALQKLAASRKTTSRGYLDDYDASEEPGHENTHDEEPATHEGDDDVEKGSDSNTSLGGFIVSDDEELSTYSSTLGSDDEYVEEGGRSLPSSPASASSISRSTKEYTRKGPKRNNTSSQRNPDNGASGAVHGSFSADDTLHRHEKDESESTDPEEQLQNELAIYHQENAYETLPTPKETPLKDEPQNQDHTDTSSFQPPRDLKISVTTPPRLLSPSKSARPRIPPSPHRPSVDAFWDQDFIDDWNNKHSAQKPLAGKSTYQLNKEKPTNTQTPSRKFGASLFNLFEDEDDFHRFAGSDGESGGELIKENKKPLTVRKRSKSKTIKSTISDNEIEKSPSKRALAVRETANKKETAAKKREFDKTKRTKASEFLQELDDKVTGGEVHRLAVPCGGLQIIWSKNLNSTAGRATWKRSSTPEGVGESPSKANRLMTASIELAEKIIDDEKRLYNTLAHEYCHLTNFMLSGIIDQPHGASFKNWAKKCMGVLNSHDTYATFGVQITTKHDYKINYRYIWNCETCGYEYGRHSKSINVDKVRCGSCSVGRLVQVKPKPRNVSPKKQQQPRSQTTKTSDTSGGRTEKREMMQNDIFDDLTRRVQVVDLD